MKKSLLALVLFIFSSPAFSQLKPLPKEIFEPPVSDYPSNQYGKVAVVQWAPSLPTPLGVNKAQAENYKQGNRQILEAYIREAASKGAKLIITPEFAIVGYPDIPELPSEEDEFRNREDIEPYVETVPGESTAFFSKLAKELGVYIHVGFAEVGQKDDLYRNVVVVINDQGEILTKFHKINLYQGETEFLVPGLKPVYYEHPTFGKIGLAICADIYSSMPMDHYSKNKIEVIALSTSWAQWNSGMNTFVSAAKRGNFYVLAANQNFFPDSGVINPDGSLQSHIRQSDGVAYGYLPLKKVAKVQNKKTDDSGNSSYKSPPKQKKPSAKTKK